MDSQLPGGVGGKLSHDQLTRNPGYHRSDVLLPGAPSETPQGSSSAVSSPSPRAGSGGTFQGMGSDKDDAGKDDTMGSGEDEAVGSGEDEVSKGKGKKRKGRREMTETQRQARKVRDARRKQKRKEKKRAMAASAAT